MDQRLKPNEKSTELRKVLEGGGRPSRDVSICATCGVDVKHEEFRDTLSVREFQISRMCQKCQDKVFADPEEDDLEHVKDIIPRVMRNLLKCEDCKEVLTTRDIRAYQLEAWGEVRPITRDTSPRVCRDCAERPF